jgi:hypothetical protein
MKRIFICILSVFLLTACASPEERMVEYLDKMAQAIDAGDDAELEELYIEYHNWYNRLSASKQKEAELAAEAWGERNIIDYYVIAFKIAELERKYAKENPTWYNTEQFMKFIKTSDGDMAVKIDEVENYYYASWSYDYNSVYIVYINDKYYIALNSPYFRPFIIIPFENADRAIAWLDGIYSKLTGVRQQLKDAGLEEVEKQITLPDPSMCYVVVDNYRSGQPDWRIDYDLRIWDSTIDVDFDREEYDYDKDQIKIHFTPSCWLTITDASYHAMVAGLKSRDVMKKKLEKYVMEEQDRERRQKQLEDSIY